MRDAGRRRPWWVALGAVGVLLAGCGAPRANSSADAAIDTPAVDAPAVDASAVDASAVDASAVDAPAVDAPVVDAPAVDAPLADRPSVGDGGRALTGSLGTLVEAHAAAGTRRLVASGFEGVSRVCVGTRCLSGGLIP